MKHLAHIALDFLVATTLLTTAACATAASSRLQATDMEGFATLMARKHGFQHDAVLQLLGQAEV